jgi:crotonobetaine/carnitine-CoA ligase
MSPLSVRTLGGLLHVQARRFGDRAFVHFGGRDLTYAELDRLATATANGLRSLGVGHGDRVCLALPNGVDFLVAWFGLTRLGAVEVPLNLDFKSPQVRYVLDDAGAVVLITDSDFLSAHQSVIENTSIRAVVLIDTTDRYVGMARAGITALAAMLAHPPSDEPLPDVAPSDPMAIIYTSGTTGDPKGVLLCHEQELTLADNVAASIDLNENDCFYNFFPMHHNTGQGIITCSVLATGGRMLLTDRFSRSRFWADVKQHGCTTFYGMGAIIEILNRDAGGSRAAAGHTLRVGWGIAIGTEQARRFRDRFGIEFVTGYGSTEVNMVAISSLGAWPAGAAGKIVDDFEVAIVDETDVPVAAGEVGEIVVRPRRPFVTGLGYWRKPAETVQAWRNMWVHTGDAGRLDGDGYLYFVDRIKDVIRHRGNNISSAEVENVILELAEVDEVAVVPAPSDLGQYDEDVLAVVVAAPGHAVDPVALIGHCARRLPYYAVPRYVEVVADLPKTSTGKVRKKDVRAQSAPDRWDRVAAGISVRSAHGSGKQKAEVRDR